MEVDHQQQQQQQQQQQSSIPPSQTLYVNNLNEKLKKEELRAALYTIFTQFGPVLDIVALKTLKMRGQAFIVFHDITSSANALRSLQGFSFYGKPMRITFAKSRSYAVGRFNGEPDSHVRRPFIPKNQRPKGEKQPGKRNPNGAAAASSNGDAQAMNTEAPAAAGNHAPMLQQQQPGFGFSQAPEIPHNILFVQNLPQGITQDDIFNLFRGYTAGSCDVRLVPNRADIAFVEYENEGIAANAKATLHGYKMGDNNLSVTFSKK
ncbi:hypothetical protein CAOG_002777 [Capsaspora owczarzaki ATCC 30864]|uniref:RRM domain-containing protein n=2 Tax=Capsaspora owczarzaki (strain ATCC 30864) TaxID=595528 RepID=A0A0D2VN57_CAPO3|nr:hypothetical protein CAOG_002777 [Capsaspora owczarzaki ATCC 30864]